MPEAMAQACHCGQTKPCPVHGGRGPRRSAPAMGYGRRWQRFRHRFIKAVCRPGIERAGLCGARLQGARRTQSSRCAAQQLVKAGHHVDHIAPHHGDPRLLYDPLNLELLCASCHARVTRLYDQQGKPKP